jgi:hypothetical protein
MIHSIEFGRAANLFGVAESRQRLKRTTWRFPPGRLRVRVRRDIAISEDRSDITNLDNRDADLE